MFNNEEFVTAKGVILSREPQGENHLWTTLFLENYGIVSLSSKNFKGDSEPFVWGYFDFKRKSRSTNYYLCESDIKDTMLNIRRGREPIVTAMNWTKYLKRYLMPEYPDNELMNTLYGCMKLLTRPFIPVDAAEWRFLRRWLEEWGLAPELEAFHASNGFKKEEISLLAKTSALSETELIALFTGTINPNIRENIFKVASKLAKKFFNEI